MKARAALVALHRWLGLTTALFLVLTGLTGSLLAFEHELDAWLAPELHHAAPPRPGMAALDPLVLRERVAAQLGPAVQVSGVTLKTRPGASTQLYVDAAPGQPPPGYDEVYANPYTGEVLGRRDARGLHWGREYIMPFIFELHCVLALPTPWGQLVMGLVAVLWTLDCFVGAWVTLPASRHPGSAAWWRAWRTAWSIKRLAGAFRRNLDLHRAGGLWLWAVLFVFAWSSVMFNLRPYVWQPVMALAFEFDDSWRELPPRAPARGPVALDWPQALAAARLAMKELAARHDLQLHFEERLTHNPEQRTYMYMAHSSADLRSDTGNTAVLIDADSGAALAHWLPTGGATGNTVSNWMGALHMGHVWGLPYRIFVCLLGAVVVGLSGTGIYLWWKKRQARLRTARLRQAAALPAVLSR